jgi:hypothetical protein
MHFLSIIIIGHRIGHTPNSTGWGDRVRVTVEESEGGTASLPPRAAVPGRGRRWKASHMVTQADHLQTPLYFQPQLQKVIANTNKYPN